MKSEKQVSIDNPLPPPKYVSFNGRLFATFIDLILSTIILMPFFSLEYPPEVAKTLNDLETGAITQDHAAQILLTQITQGSGITNIYSNSMIQFFVSALVIILFWFFRSATPGKMLLKMRIVDADTGGKPSLLSFFIRYIGYFVSLIPFCLGFFWIGIDKRKQGWHDKMGNTVVIYTDENPTRNFLIVFAAIIIITIILLFV